MAPLVLLLCAGFVKYLLWLERKQAPKVSSALWIPSIWMLYEASRPLAAWLMVAEAEDAGSSPFDQIFLIGLLCLGLLVLVRRKVNWYSTLKQNVWLMILLSYMFVSVLWSDIPFVSFKRWIREFEAVVMAFVLISEEDPRQALECLLRRVAYIHIPLSWILIKYFPNYGVQYSQWTGDLMWVGVSTQKNGLGTLCLISIFFIVWTLVRRWQGSNIAVSRCHTPAEVLLLVLAIMLLKGPGGAYSSTSGYSSTAVTALAVGLTTFFGLTWRKKRGGYVAGNALSSLVVLMIGYGTALPFAGEQLEGVTSALGRDSTFTGRTSIWAKLVPVFEERPVLGCGFGGFWTPETRAIYIFGQAHNGYLQVLMELGMIGLVLASVFLVSCVRKAARALTKSFDWAGLCICLVVMAALQNVTEASMNTFTNFLSAVVLFAAICVGDLEAPRAQNSYTKCTKQSASGSKHDFL